MAKGKWTWLYTIIDMDWQCHDKYLMEVNSVLHIFNNVKRLLIINVINYMRKYD